MNQKAVKNKIKATSNIKKITRTMEMVSVSKMKKASEEALSIRPFSKMIADSISDIGPQITDSKFFKENNSKEKLLIIIASNKGLCGGYNSNVSKKAFEVVKENISANSDAKFTKAITIGKFAEKTAKKLNLEVLLSNQEKIVTDESLKEIANTVIESFLSKKISEVHIVYTEFIKSGIYSTTSKKVLPISLLDIEDINTKKDVVVGGSFVKEVTFEPSRLAVADNIIPIYINSILKRCVAESAAGEHSSRMFAMKQATDNASEMLHDLKIKYNRARQAKVTQEIAEIVGGSAALAES